MNAVSPVIKFRLPLTMTDRRFTSLRETQGSQNDIAPEFPLLFSTDLLLANDNASWHRQNMCPKHSRDGIEPITWDAYPSDLNFMSSADAYSLDINYLYAFGWRIAQKQNFPRNTQDLKISRKTYGTEFPSSS